MQVAVSAPGKIHLIGEHVVVYGYPALLTAINKRVYVKINLKSQISNLKSKENVVIHTSSDKKLISYSIDIFKKQFFLDKIPPIEISITSQIPIGSGMGSSAATAAAIIGALMKYIKNIWNPAKINEITYEVEKYTHGNPSGADNSTVTFGGLVWYRKEFDFLKSIWSLPILQYHLPHFWLIDSGRAVESTKEMVEYVAALYRENTKKMDTVFTDQQVQTKKMLLALRENNIEKLKGSISNAERNLEKIGVVGHYARTIIREVEQRGGVAKITGAGGVKKGSGMILCYHKQGKPLQQIAQKYNAFLFPVDCGQEGIRLESVR